MIVPTSLIVCVEKRLQKIYCGRKLCGRKIGYISSGGSNIFVCNFRECRLQHVTTGTDLCENGMPLSLFVSELVEIDESPGNMTQPKITIGRFNDSVESSDSSDAESPQRSPLWIPPSDDEDQPNEALPVEAESSTDNSGEISIGN